jgi:nucleoside-diphosphate-sugar epimerase
VLITGASGTIGRHCVTALVERGAQVHAVGRQLRANPRRGIVWHRADFLIGATTVEAILREVRPTHLLHLAWVTEHGAYWHAPANANWLVASLRLVQQFLHFGGKRVVTVGSAAEYATSTDPCRETTTPCAPGTLYGACKNALQLGAASLTSQRASHAHARLFQVFGPHEDSRRLVPTLLRHLRDGQPLPCTSGQQVRDFIYVEHAAQALVTLLFSEVAGPVNIGSGRPRTVREFATQLAAAAGADARLLQFGTLPQPPHEQPVLTADVNRLRSEVKFTDADAVELGIRNTVEVFNNLAEMTPCPTFPTAPFAAVPTLTNF